MLGEHCYITDASITTSKNELFKKQDLSDLLWTNLSTDERKKEMVLMRKLNQEEREQNQKQNLKHLKQLAKV